VSHACCGEPEVSAPQRSDSETSAARLDGAASATANALTLAAAPIFALLALWIAFAGDRLDMACMGMQNASSLDGMALMYALMSAFHATSWLKLVSRR
jgi:hypothetical protein